MRVRVDASGLRPPDEVMRELGVDARGKVQQFVTDRVRFRMQRYMPWDTGFTVTSAQYLYNGVSRSGNALDYTKTTNPMAGPFWDRTLVQNEGDAIAEEAASYSRSING